ncbi:hypothetical protein EZS27_025896 [termite gut metagenome]|uniref:Tyrosine recombinase XerC n=1 Tax=termite gut metagenome TaxID=433724 RepID=A0A5J4QSH9_9ZZZZ
MNEIGFANYLRNRRKANGDDYAESTIQKYVGAIRKRENGEIGDDKRGHHMYSRAETLYSEFLRGNQ